VRQSASDVLRYGRHPSGEHTRRSPTERRPVVVWNVTRCNLACTHCYASAKHTPAADELATGDPWALDPSCSRVEAAAV